MRSRSAERAAAAVALFALAATAAAQDRFPRPEFDSGYALPVTATPPPRAPLWEYADVALLFAALSLAAYLALRRRSRAAMALLAGGALLYFGFWRKGCVCPVGSLQNVALALSDRRYAVPLPVLLFFLLPLLFALLFGRVFCGGVCPLGAIQDLVVLRPLRLPRWVAHAAGVIPAAYLGAALLYAAAGSRFIVCRFDPFVGFFRLSGPAWMLAAGAGLLLAGTVVARPYCRFFCPYGVLLRACSRLSKWHLTIAPEQCINCRLCEEACPFDAIEFPSAALTPVSRARAVRRVVLLALLLPAAVVGGAWGGWRAGPALASLDLKVQLARQALVAESGGRPARTEDLDQYWETGGTLGALFGAATRAEGRFAAGSALFGAFIGTTLVMKLLRLSTHRRVDTHTPDRGLCFSCGRCFSFCPLRRKRGQGPPAGRSERGNRGE